MHHLVRQAVLQMSLVPDLVRADEDARSGVEAAALAMDLAVLGQPGRTPRADDVGAVQLAVQGLDLLPQEPHRGRVLQRPVPVLLAPLAVARLVRHGPRLPVVERPFLVYGTRQDLEVVHPPFRVRVEARALRVVPHYRGESIWVIGCGCCGRGGG